MKKMSKKIISMLICLLLMGMIPVAVGMNNYKDKIETEVDSDTDYSNSGMPVSAGAEKPIIEIKVKTFPDFVLPFLEMDIRNIGDANATNVEWRIRWYGGWILGEKFALGARINTGNISILAPEASKTYNYLKRGFGRVAIVIHAECTEGSSDAVVLEAFMYGPFLMYIKIIDV